ncbi:MAG: response regulator [Balneolaceae bacterium]|nr:response regulator [Balneolaceae bacterium]MBO6546266.1 response regulator [Balneolaceae bacterium]MBO6648625.1 response regulator [Balneolaceae bacterium]
MKYTVLVIDDDEPIHFMTKNLLGSEFNLVHAKNAQEAIDILSNTKINLILSDIHMPGLTGLELLESLRQDDEKKKIPVLVMTNLPTVEKEKKALDLGAADFIKKELFTSNKERILELVRMKLVTDIDVTDLEEDLADNKNKLVMRLMESALSGSFNDTVDVLCSELLAILDSNFLGFWIVNRESSELIHFYGEDKPDDSSLAAFNEEQSFKQLQSTQEPYLCNHIYNDELGFFTDFSKEHKLSAEIAVPLFSINEKNLLMNSLKVPEKSSMFGVIVIKRSVLFSSNEFMLISRLITQTGSILWRLYKKTVS